MQDKTLSVVLKEINCSPILKVVATETNDGYNFVTCEGETSNSRVVEELLEWTKSNVNYKIDEFPDELKSNGLYKYVDDSCILTGLWPYKMRIFLSQDSSLSTTGSNFFKITFVFKEEVHFVDCRA